MPSNNPEDLQFLSNDLSGYHTLLVIQIFHPAMCTFFA